MSSSTLIWDLIKRNHSYLMKTSGHQFSKDPLNLKGKNCFMYCGFVHRKAIGIRQDVSGKGIVLNTKKVGKDYKPGKSVTSTKFVRGRRRALLKIRNLICRQGYRRELKMLALRRASALLKNLKPVTAAPAKTKKSK